MFEEHNKPFDPEKGLLILDVMSDGGHDEWDYSIDDPKKLRGMAEQILDKIRIGHTLYGGAKEDKELTKIADLRTIQKAPNKTAFVEEQLQKFEKFLLSKELEKKLLAAPVTGG